MVGQRVLLVGGGIAGMAAAHWLVRSGHEVVVVDRIPAFVPRGHFIALKGTGVQVLKAMGLHDALAEFRVPTNDVEIRTAADRLVRRAQMDQVDVNLGGYLMVRRAHLHQVLFEALPDDVDVRFATTVEDLADHGSHVEVVLTGGGSERFDIVVGADGVHSQVRRRVFPELRVQRMRAHYAVFVVDVDCGIGGRTHAYFGSGREVNLIPVGEQRAGMVVYQDDGVPRPPRSSAPLDWKVYLSDVYAGFPQPVRAAVAAVDAATEVYHDDVVMIPAEALAKGRVGLLGDAGSAPSFFSGMGAAAALQGAYALDRQLAAAQDGAAALVAYEKRMLAVVAAYQSSARQARRLVLARGVAAEVRNALFRLTPQWLADASSRRFYRTEASMAALS